MKHATDYQIIYKGLFSETDFRFEVIPGKRKYNASTRKLINEAWQEARLNPDLHIFNGKVISLLSADIHHDEVSDRDKMLLKVQATDYKSSYGTNISNPLIIPKDELANVLSACAVVETTEGSVFVGKRNPNMAETADLWHVPGGSLHKVINPIAFMQIELEEELNVVSRDIQYAVCLGFGENFVTRKPEFLCYFHLNLTEKQLSDKLIDAKDKDEHTEYVFVPMEELDDFIGIYPFAPIGKACITRYLEYIQSL